MGIFIGVLLSFLLFRTRSCNKWLPGERVRYMIQDQPLRLSNEVKCLAACYGLPAGFVGGIAHEGNVNYKKSDQRSVPQRYYLEAKGRNAAAVTVELRDTASVVIALHMPEARNCDC